MPSRAKLFGHPIHPILIVFPLGLFAMAVIFDIAQLITGNPNLSLAAYYMIGAGAARRCALTHSTRLAAAGRTLPAAGW